MKTPAHLSCSVAALALLLAACGGGGGNDNGNKAVSASPVAPVNPLAPANTGSGITDSTPPASGPDAPSPALSDNRARSTPNTATPPVDSGTTPPAAQPQPQPQPANPAPTPPAADGATSGTPAPTTKPAPLVSAQGVRGDVLLTMLDQRSCMPFGTLSASHDGPSLENDGDFPPPWISHSLSAENYLINPEHRSSYEHSPVPGALCPPVLIYTPAATGVYTYRLNSSIYGRFTSPDSRPRGFSMMHTSIPVAISQDAIIIGSRIEATANAYWGKTFRDANPDGQPKDTEYNFGQSPSSKTIGLNSFVPIGVLTTWKDESNGTNGSGPYTMTTHMMLLPGSHARQAKLCFDTYMKYVKRLHCTVWTVPENWKRGLELKDDGQYIVDDRSTYPGESGLLYWRTGGRD